MPKDDPSSNGKKPPKYETVEVNCRKCGKVFQGLTFETVDTIERLSISWGFVEAIKIRCKHCGQVFFWSLHEKELERYEAKVDKLLMEVRRYKPE